MTFSDAEGLRGGGADAAQARSSTTPPLSRNPLTDKYGPINFYKGPDLPPVDDACVRKYINDNYGNVFGFMADLGNLQQYLPSNNEDWRNTNKEAAIVLGEKGLATKGPGVAGNLILRSGPVSANAMATAGGLI